MEKETRTILGVGFLALLGWLLFRKPKSITLEKINPLPPKKDKFKIKEDAYFYTDDGMNVAFVIPKDTIIEGVVLPDGSLQVTTSYGTATILQNNFESVDSSANSSEKSALGCFSYSVKNVNDVMLDDDGGVIDVASDLHYVTCEGEPNDMTLSTGDGEVIVSNVIEGSMVSGDSKILITKA